MKEVTSVLEFANAAAIERINYELVKVIENIQNPNTDEKPRKLTVELCLTPVNNRTTVNIKTTVKKQLRRRVCVVCVAKGLCGRNRGTVDIGGRHESNHLQGQRDKADRERRRR